MMQKTTDLSALFTHIFVDNQAEKTLLLLHGTGADEHDLLPLAERVAGDEYNFLSLRGNVVERGMNRFFARRGFGVFDEASIRQEAAKLKEFVELWRTQTGTVQADLIPLGFSNGANMILAALLLYPDLFDSAVLLHPMMPLEVELPATALENVKVLVTSGEQDQMISPAESAQVSESLKKSGATLRHEIFPGGHGLTPAEVKVVTRFLAVSE